MPPALSDDESNDSSVEEEVVAIRGGKSQSNTPAKYVRQVSDEEEVEAEEQLPINADNHNDDDDDDDDDDVEDQDGGVYVVEKIIGDQGKGKSRIFHVRWEGFPDLKDHTWETAENLASAQEVLDTYLAEKARKQGTRSLKNQRSEEDYEGSNAKTKKTTGNKRKGRKSAADRDGASDTPNPAAKRVKQEWEPPAGSWEHDVDYVETVDECLNPKTGNVERHGYVIWSNGKKTQHPLHHLYQKCPQKMLKYYEQHLVFNRIDETDDSLNGA